MKSTLPIDGITSPNRLPVRSLTIGVLTAIVVAVGARFAGDGHFIIAGTAIGLVASALCVFFARGDASELVERSLKALTQSSRTVKIGLALFVFCALLLTAKLVLDGFANSDDEYAYILQAHTYALGRLWMPAPPVPEAFALERFRVHGDMWLSQYEPGWSALMTPAVWLGIPLWVVDPILGVGLLLAVWALTRQQARSEAAWAATICVAVSAFFILNSASYFSHVATALWGVLFALFGLRYLQNGKARDILIAGAFMGLVGLTRAFNAFVFAVPFIIALAMTPGRRKGFLWFVLGGLPFAALLLADNKAVTGNALTMVQAWLNTEGEPFGGLGRKAMDVTFVRFDRLMATTSPLLVLALIPAFITLSRRKLLTFVDWIAPLTIVAFLFYSGEGGPQYGARYYFEAFPFAVVTLIKALDIGLAGTAGRRWKEVAAAALVAIVAVEAGNLYPMLSHEHRAVVQCEDLYRKAAAAHLKNAVVIVSSATGKIRWMGPADLIQNGIRVGSRPVVYALDLGAGNERIAAAFPDRRFYRYKDGAITPIPGLGAAAN